VHVGHVDAVGDEREAVALALAPQADQPGRVAGQLDDLEAGHDVALAHPAVDVDGAAVPYEPVREAMQEPGAGEPPRSSHTPSATPSGGLQSSRRRRGRERIAAGRRRSSARILARRVTPAG